MVILLQLAVVAVFQGGDRSIKEYVQSGLRDFDVTGRIVKSVPNELRKINKDYGMNYAFDTTTVRFKEPFKMRVESKVEDTTALAIYNGSHLKIRIPSLHITKREDLTASPARQETTLDIGILVPSLFNGFFNARFVHIDRESGNPVFDVTYADKTEGARYRIWIDPVRHILTKREWYNRYGTQLATFFYERPKEINGIWMPTMITVKNIDNQVAAITAYDSVRVNSGEPDSLFSID